jgi:hypothetical protein
MRLPNVLSFICGSREINFSRICELQNQTARNTLVQIDFWSRSSEFPSWEILKHKKPRHLVGGL